MPLFNLRYKYGWMAVALHWLLFIMLAAAIAGGKYSDSLSRDEKIFWLIDIHKQLGVAIVLLMTFRLFWRLINFRLEAMSDAPLINFSAFIVHWLLYLSIITQGLIGVAMSQSAGNKVELLGLALPTLVGQGGWITSIPFLAGTGKELAGALRGLHGDVGWVIIGLIALHILGALFHHFILRDDTLRRMWFSYVPNYAKKTPSRYGEG